MQWVNTHTEPAFVTSVNVLLDRRIVYSDCFGNICVWDVKTNETIKWEGHSDMIDCVKEIYGKIMSGARDGIIKIWDIPESGDTRIYPRELKYLPGVVGAVKNICSVGLYHIVSTHQYIQGECFDVNIWNLKKFHSVSRLKSFSGSVRRCAVQCRHNKIFIGHENKISVWDLSVPDEHPIQTLAGHGDIVTSVVFKGDKLVSGSKDNTVKVWNRSGNSWSCELTQIAPESVRCVSVFNDKVIYATKDKKLKIWDLRTKVLQTINVKEPIVALTCYFGKIITGSMEGARIWEYKDQTPVVKLGHKTFPTGTRLFTLITRDTFDKTRDLAFFGKHLGLNVRATLHNTSQSNNLWLHVFNTTEPLRMLTTPKHWRHEIFGEDLGFSRLERRLKKYCQENGYDGWHMKVFSDNHGHTFKGAEYETVIIRSSFDKLQFRGKKQIALEDLKDKDHVRVSKKGKITFVKRVERLEDMFENLRF